jgi:hypothetical protein
MPKELRQITLHHDGHGLNESLRIEADEIGPGGASHEYSVTIDGREVASIQFQKGPRGLEDSTPGCTEAVLLAILIDRLQHFQRGPFPSRENAIQITKLEESLMWARRRADERAARGVLGKNEK